MDCIVMTGTKSVKKSLAAIVFGMVLCMSATSWASSQNLCLPTGVISTLHYLLDFRKEVERPPFDTKQLEPYLAFLSEPKSADAIYNAGNSFSDPSAFNQFSIDVDLQRIIDYTLDADIPSFFFWPSSLRMSDWITMDGGKEQLALIKNTSESMEMPFILRGSEHVSITPDQHTGAYFTYDVNKMIVLCSHGKGKVLLSVQGQEAPSAVGRKGWVLGEDEEWNYLYTDEKGLGLKGLGWADTYMYDSYNVTVYYQPDPNNPMVICSSVSWVNAGWAGINMVKSKHIHRGLKRVAEAFTAVMKNPRLPEPAALAETFSKKEDLPTPMLRQYTSEYLVELQRRLSTTEGLWEKVRASFDKNRLLDQMSRDEMYATLALDYFKKVLGHNPVMDTHPF
jgi:hypothetical protein